MKYFYFYIFLLSLFIICVSYYNTLYSNVESFYNNNNNNTIILLGDSILKNNAYVSNGKSINDLLLERSNKNVYCYARDHSKIVDVYSQVDDIPLNLNNKDTTIFLSAGGNDILTYYVDQENDSKDTSVLNPMFSSYKTLVNSIQTKMPNSKLVLLDIYYPDNLQYTQYHNVISEWNNMIHLYANDYKNNINGVLKISGKLKNSNDFSFGIEPSFVGGEKIVESIINYQ